MRGFLLTYNPAKSGTDYFDELIEEVETYGEVQDNWSCGNRSDLPPGSALFLMRLGVEPKGLVGFGTATSWPHEEAHWDADRREEGVTSNFVDFRFTTLVHEPVFPLDELSFRFSQMRWTPQSSGVEIPEAILAVLLEELHQRVVSDVANPEEVPPGTTYAEGAVRTAIVNRFERSRGARDACVMHFGCACYVCGLELSKVYGERAKGFIHVHHVRPISDLGEEYIVDPIRDLIPVCPNCHAVVHLSSPPMDVHALKEELGRTKL